MSLAEFYKNGCSYAEDLVERLDFRDENPEVIDLSPEGGVVASLKESMVECVVADKVRGPCSSASPPDVQDLYLYYFLLRYPGRSLVFVGSIDGIRRLTPLFETLQLPIFPLHSQLQQKQRLKNLDRCEMSRTYVAAADSQVQVIAQWCPDRYGRRLTRSRYSQCRARHPLQLASHGGRLCPPKWSNGSSTEPGFRTATVCAGGEGDAAGADEVARSR